MLRRATAPLLRSATRNTPSHHQKPLRGERQRVRARAPLASKIEQGEVYYNSFPSPPHPSYQKKAPPLSLWQPLKMKYALYFTNSPSHTLLFAHLRPISNSYKTKDSDFRQRAKERSRPRRWLCGVEKRKFARRLRD